MPATITELHQRIITPPDPEGGERCSVRREWKEQCEKPEGHFGLHFAHCDGDPENAWAWG